MSLTEKYEKSINNQGNNISDNVEFDPLIVLPENANKLIKEAIALIDNEKWHKAKMHFEKKDLRTETGHFEKGTYYYLMDDLQRSDNGAFYHDSYAKIKSPSGKISCVVLSRPNHIVKPSFFGIKASMKPGSFISQTNTERSQLTPQLYGDQNYVVLEHNYVKNGIPIYGQLVLFKDSFLFCFDSGIRIDNEYIYHDDHKMVFEDWLLRSLKRINGVI